jgi:hypothetical protein
MVTHPHSLFFKFHERVFAHFSDGNGFSGRPDSSVKVDRAMLHRSDRVVQSTYLGSTPHLCCLLRTMLIEGICDKGWHEFSGS